MSFERGFLTKPAVKALLKDWPLPPAEEHERAPRLEVDRDAAFTKAVNRWVQHTEPMR